MAASPTPSLVLMSAADYTDAYGDPLEEGYSGVVYEVLPAIGLANKALPHGILPLLPERKLAERVYSIGGRAKTNLDGRETLRSWTEMLSRAPRGSVVMMRPNDSTMSHMGELSSETLLLRGVRGYIVIGGVATRTSFGESASASGALTSPRSTSLGGVRPSCLASRSPSKRRRSDPG